MGKFTVRRERDVLIKSVYNEATIVAERPSWPKDIEVWSQRRREKDKTSGQWARDDNLTKNY